MLPSSPRSSPPPRRFGAAARIALRFEQQDTPLFGGTITPEGLSRATVPWYTLERSSNDAAVMAGGFCGFMMGTTANAMANAAVAWSLIYAALGVYWAAGGRGFPYTAETATDSLSESPAHGTIECRPTDVTPSSPSG